MLAWLARLNRFSDWHTFPLGWLCWVFCFVVFYFYFYSRQTKIQWIVTCSSTSFQPISNELIQYGWLCWFKHFFIYFYSRQNKHTLNRYVFTNKLSVYRRWAQPVWMALLFMLISSFRLNPVNTFTAAACKLSGLKDARTHLNANGIFSGPITHLLPYGFCER